ncbi:epoxide hydrolase [Winogradskya consettensis]|uniref:Hydrolase n=1 Tax=Winogradskya consettensis TaxID=113560 RepID=A0A919SZI4_9ACTN|nr:epoxide hydrolase family protein [Actinoplanes consettensis]GIM79893.1 hydrolase [Actinoplanes consettensis]
MFTVAEEELADLRDRLRRTRWGRTWPGTDDSELRDLVAYWAGDFDWRAREAAINALPAHFADVAGTRLHYLRYDGGTPDVLPIVLTHGWPSSILELTGLAERLAAAGFTVIVPSLPGYAFSQVSDVQTHELWHRLMTENLGFSRYAAHGGDLGAGVTARLGQAYPEAVVGIHVLAVADPPRYDPDTLTPDERAHLDRQASWLAEEGAYQHQQRKRPLTLSPGLADSPVGLLAWLLEKYRSWSDTPFTDDFVLTQTSLYWFTGTIATSFRPYYDHAQGRVTRIERVEVPTAVALFPKDLSHPPRSWAERTYHVERFTTMPRGGHFAAHEEPDLLAADIVAFFADKR